MLLTTITSLDDQEIAERMRAIAVRLHCNRALTEQAADEAVMTYQRTGSADKALSSGIEFIWSFRQPVEVPTSPAANDHVRDPFTWVESWPVIVGALGVALLMLYA